MRKMRSNAERPPPTDGPTISLISPRVNLEAAGDAASVISEMAAVVEVGLVRGLELLDKSPTSTPCRTFGQSLIASIYAVYLPGQRKTHLASFALARGPPHPHNPSENTATWPTGSGTCIGSHPNYTHSSQYCRGLDTEGHKLCGVSR